MADLSLVGVVGGPWRASRITGDVESIKGDKERYASQSNNDDELVAYLLPCGYDLHNECLKLRRHLKKKAHNDSREMVLTTPWCSSRITHADQIRG